MGGLFSKKAFHGGQSFLGKGRVFYMGGLMIALRKGRGSFTNAISSNPNTINSKVFPKHGGIGFIVEVIS